MLVCAQWLIDPLLLRAAIPQKEDVTIMSAEPVRFADLFRNPSIDAMYALSPKDFEHFIAYVLQRAGYTVKEVGPHFLRGLDLEMRLPGKSTIFGGVECKRFASNQLVTAPIVRGVRGAPAVD